MSNKISGVFRTPKGAQINGRLGKRVDVSVNISSKTNRKTDGAVLTRYTKNGFDWAKWHLPIVAYIKSTEEVYLLDGDHRRHMYKQFHPQAEKMPAWQIEVEDEQEFHRRFVEINSTHRKNVNGDEAFIHLVCANDSEALIIQKDLIACGVSVNGSPESGGIVGAPNSPHVKVNSFKRALKVGDQTSVKSAAGIIIKAWDPSRYPEWATKIHGELLQGFSVLYHHYKCLSDGSDFQKDFDNWVNNVLSVDSPDVVATQYKKAAGRPQHRQGYAIAFAIISDFRKANPRGSLTTVDKKRRSKALALKKVRCYLDC